MSLFSSAKHKETAACYPLTDLII